MDHNQEIETEKVAILNDKCRKNQDRTAKIVFTKNLLEILSGGNVIKMLMHQKALLDCISQHQFNPEDDNYGERDFGSFEYTNQTVIFKIDYYAKDDLVRASEDPSNETVTTRVMTIMLASDY